MFERYAKRIEAYCEREGIEIPVGFYRHDAGRYAAIDLGSRPPKLVATTWNHEADAIRYIEGLGAGHSTKMFDIKEQCELAYHGGATLAQGEPM